MKLKHNYYTIQFLDLDAKGYIRVTDKDMTLFQINDVTGHMVIEPVEPFWAEIVDVNGEEMLYARRTATSGMYYPLIPSTKEDFLKIIGTL